MPLIACPAVPCPTVFDCLTAADLDAPLEITGVEGLKGFLGPEYGATGRTTLRTLLKQLQATYCGGAGYEYMHITSRDKCNWLRERIEQFAPVPFPKAKKVQILDRLAYADHFERFLAQKFNTAKRFGLEGAESLIPGEQPAGQLGQQQQHAAAGDRVVVMTVAAASSSLPPLPSPSPCPLVGRLTDWLAGWLQA